MRNILFIIIILWLGFISFRLEILKQNDIYIAERSFGKQPYNEVASIPIMEDGSMYIPVAIKDSPTMDKYIKEGNIVKREVWYDLSSLQREIK